MGSGTPILVFDYSCLFKHSWLRQFSSSVLSCDAGELGSIPGLGRSPGEGNDYPLQYSWLENSMDRRAWQATVHGVAKSRTRLSDQHISAFPGCVVNTQINLNQLNEPCVL